MNPRWMLWLAHGPELFALMVACLALLGAWVAPGVWRRLRGASHRRMLASLGVVREEVPAGEGVAAVLRGTLRSTDAAEGVVVVTERYAPLPDGTISPPRTGVTGTLTLETRSGVIRIAGEPEVIVGAAHAVATAVSGDGARVVGRTALRAGEAVRVEGVLEPATAEAAAVSGYRGAAPTWRMVAGAHGRVRVAAEVVSGGVGTRGQRAAGAAALAMLGAMVMTAGAAVAMRSAAAMRGPVEVGTTRAWCDGTGMGRAVLASASPLHRRDALDAVALTTRCARRRDVRAKEWLDAALRLRGAPRVERAYAMEEMGDHRGAADVLMTCDGAEPKVRAAWIRAGLGEFALASDALRAGAAGLRTESELHRAVTVHAMAGRWSDAAATARRAAESAAGRRGQHDEDAYVQAMWCFADASGARAGDDEALRRLELRLGQRESAACRSLRAEVAIARGESAASWLAAGDGDGEWYPRPSLDWAERHEYAAFRSLRDCAEPSGRCARPSGEGFDALSLDGVLAVRPYEADLLRRYRAMPALTPGLEADAARLAISEARALAASGNFIGALETIRWANDHSGSVTASTRRELLHAQAWIAAASGDHDAVDAALGELDGVGERAPEAMVPLAVRRWADRDVAGLAYVALHSIDARDAREALTERRGDMLMGWLRRQPGVVPRAGRRAVLAGVVFGVVDREEARRWLRTEDVWMDPGSITRTWRAAALRMAIAAQVGDVEMAREMRAVVERHRAVMDRRDLARTLLALGP